MARCKEKKDNEGNTWQEIAQQGNLILLREEKGSFQGSTAERSVLVPGEKLGKGSWKPIHLWHFGHCSPIVRTCDPHANTLAWKIPWAEESGRLQSMGSRRVVHDWATSLSLFTFMHCRRKWQPTPVFLPGESQGRGSLVGCRLWGRTE